MTDPENVTKSAHMTEWAKISLGAYKAMSKCAVWAWWKAPGNQASNVCCSMLSAVPTHTKQSDVLLNITGPHLSSCLDLRQRLQPQSPMFELCSKHIDAFSRLHLKLMKLSSIKFSSIPTAETLIIDTYWRHLEQAASLGEPVLPALSRHGLIQIVHRESLKVYTQVHPAWPTALTICPQRLAFATVESSLD